MVNKIKKICFCLLAVILISSSVHPLGVSAGLLPPTEQRFTPRVLTEEITDRTTSVSVYVYDNTTLYIKNGRKVIFRKFYEEKGLRNVKIKKQEGKSKLKFYLIAQSSGLKGGVVTRKVEKLPVVAPEKIDNTIPRPIVSPKITSKTASVQVKGRKNTTLVIKNEKKILKTVKFRADAKKKIKIPIQKEGKLYFYLRRGNSRGKVVSKTIEDVTAPRAPKVKIAEHGIGIKGERGTKIYLEGSEGWEVLGIVLEKGWNQFSAGVDYFNTECEYYRIYLQDAAGNKSKAVKVKNPQPGPPPMVTP